MADKPRDSGVSLGGFFSRSKLPPGTQGACDEFVRSRYSASCRPAPFQGYCSYTIFVGEDTIVQFRPADYSLNVTLVSAACEIFGSLVAETKFLGTLDDTGLHIYSMRRLSGLSLSELRNASTHSNQKLQRQSTVRDFARLQAMSWSHARPRDQVREKGLVGSSLQWRLDLLSSCILDRFQKFTKSLRPELAKIEDLPWVLSHGDFLPANVLVCPENGKMVGLLDWAEAEYLPFGISFYGLEELLGDARDGSFAYYPEASRIRRLFWSELLAMIPELKWDPKKLRTVQMAHIFGILLWHGIAFNDGKLDLAVKEGIDDEEISRLDAFLLGPLGPATRYARDDMSWFGASTTSFRKILFGTPRETDQAVN